MKKIAVYGAGGFGREVKTIIDAINQGKPDSFEFIGFYDDNPPGDRVNGFPVLGGITELNNYQDSLGVALAIGNPITKKNVLDKISNPHIHFPSLIHPKASLSKDSVEIGKGVIICEGNILTCNIRVGDFVILNLSCTVGHDAQIGSYSSIMPTVNISGEVIMMESVYVGTGATIINQVNVGSHSIIGAGAVVIRDVPDYATVVGNPGKIIKIHREQG